MVGERFVDEVVEMPDMVLGTILGGAGMLVVKVS